MTGTNPTVIFSGDSNHGVQLASNFGHVNVNFHGQPHKLEDGHLSDEEKRCFETIRTSNYLARKDLNPERLPGTCNWFFDHPKYRDWKAHMPASRLLWVSANPGCGKSVLAKALVDQYDRGNVCYFFFKDDTTITRSAAHAICAILHQICNFRPALITYVLPMYRSNGRKLIDLFEDLWSAFVDVINDASFGSVICIFDAVDECSGDDFKKLLKKLAAIAVSSTSIKILITSRPYTSIETALFHKTGLDKNEIRLSGEAEAEQSMIEKEVGLYITSRVQEFRELRESDGIFDNAPENLQVHLDGVKNRTYLWVSAVFNELERDVYASGSILMETINALPDTVHNAYEKILDKSPKKHILIWVLHTMLAAFRPLSVMEMNMVLSIQDTSSGGPRYSDLHQVDSFCKWLRDLCGFFVNIIDYKLYFAHQTAREFLVGEEGYQATVGWRGSFQTAESHTRLAWVCIDYLLLWYSGFLDDTFEVYATMYWPIHCQQLEVNQSLAEKANRLLFHSDSFARWTMAARQFSSLTGLNLDRRITSSISSPPTPLFLACNFGWPSVIHVLMSSSGIDWDQITKEQETGLAITARENHLQIAKLLVAAGANVNAESGGRMALHLAASKGHLEIVKLLLAHGADFEIESLYGETALQSAASEGHSEIVKFLLKAGAIVNGKSGKGTALNQVASRGRLEILKSLLNAEVKVIEEIKGGTALDRAASRGHLEIVELLLAAGADLEIQNVDGETTLNSAASQGRVEIVKLLLKAGANVNAISKRGTALHIAAEIGKLELVQLLLNAGADINAETWRGTSLHLAASRGYLEIMEFLLATGADFEIRNQYGETALHLAIEKNRLEIVRLLLKVGANVNAEDEEETALNRAASKGHLEIVGLLLRAGANVNAESERGTALHIAASEGHIEIVELLLAAGADIEIRNFDGETALHIAASDENPQIGKLLLNVGANVNAESKWGTALHRAAERGRFQIVQLLLNAGADVNAQHHQQVGVKMTALHLAAANRHIEIVKLLLTARADVNADGYHGRETALHIAASLGHLQIVELLLNAGANVNAESEGGTVLDLARWRGHVEIEETLLAAGASISTASKMERVLLTPQILDSQPSPTGHLSRT